MTYDHIPSLAQHPGHSRAMAVAAIGQQDIARLHGNATKRFPTPDSRDGNEITDQRRQPHHIVNPPVNAGGARFLRGRGVNDSPATPLFGQAFRPITRAPDPPAQRLQPASGRPQPFKQRHIGKFRPTKSLRPHHGLTEGQPAGHMQKNQAQQSFGAVHVTAAA